MKLLISLILLNNLFCLFLCGLDKSRAKHRKYRVPEQTFFILAFLGGSIGVIVGMMVFHHKVSKPSFYGPILCAFLFNLVFSYFYFI